MKLWRRCLDTEVGSLKRGLQSKESIDSSGYNGIRCICLEKVYSVNRDRSLIRNLKEPHSSSCKLVKTKREEDLSEKLGENNSLNKTGVSGIMEAMGELIEILKESPIFQVFTLYINVGNSRALHETSLLFF